MLDVGDGLEDGEERVVVPLQLGPLVRVHRVLDGQRVQAELARRAARTRASVGSCRPIHTKRVLRLRTRRTAASNSCGGCRTPPAVQRPVDDGVEEGARAGLGPDTCAGTCRRPGTTARSGRERASGVRASPRAGVPVGGDGGAVGRGAVGSRPVGSSCSSAGHRGPSRCAAAGREGPRRGDVGTGPRQRGRERTAEGPAGTEVPVKRPVLAGLSPLCMALTSSGSPITTLPRRG